MIRQARNKFNLYYSNGNFYGKSSSSIFYNLAQQLNRSNKDMLWWWIVGLADIQLHQKSAELEHTEEIGKCNDEVFRLHPVKLNNQMQEANEQELDYKNKDFFSLISGDLVTETQDVGTITIQRS